MPRANRGVLRLPLKAAQSGAAAFLLRDLDRSVQAGRGLFTLLMCGACQAVRRSGLGLKPIEVAVHANLLEPYLQWGLPAGRL
jgi:hypothetical protein